MTKVLLWIAFALALIGGSGLVGNGYTTPVMIIATFAVIIVIALDIKKDGKPDQYAIIGAFVMPTLITRAGNGTATQHVQGWFNHLWSWANETLGSWVGTTSVGLTLFAIAISFLISHKTAPRMGR